ncbi:hypothetical protein CYY_002930 [Polysphondylium violaceum]|uniref:Uncharacterized protein n=1 Tax=Polysphondylium violaceum TaxID=133409 RepID=A0A8J4V1S2_9MYCE|nr:hypothetical protein CYY_002930 [Polysphondylium violaceum]
MINNNSLLEKDRKLLLDFIFKQYANVLQYSKYSIVTDHSSVDVNELLQFLQKSPSPPTSVTAPSSTGSTPTTPRGSSPNGHHLPPLPPTPTHKSSSSSSPNSTQSPPPPPSQIPQGYGVLTKEQFHFASYETSLLINHFSRPRDLVNHEEDESFRVQNEISKIKHQSFLKSLTPKDTGTPRPLYHSLTYRLWILKHIEFSNFDSKENLVFWFQRQLYFVLEGLKCIIQGPVEEKEDPNVAKLKYYAYQLECALVNDNPTGSQDPIYSNPFNVLDKFIGSIISRNSPHAKSQQQEVYATEYLNSPIPHAFPFNTNLFEDLLFYSLFEFEDDEIKFIGDEHYRVQPILKPLSTALKISSTMESICHLNCFITAYQAEPRDNHFERLRGSLNAIQKSIETNISLVQDPSTSSAHLLKNVLKRTATWLVKLLSDVHSYKGSSPAKDIGYACAIYVQSREMWSLLSSNKTVVKTTESNFTALITSSVSCHYERLIKPYRPMTVDNFSEFAESLIPDIRLTLKSYIKGFEKFHGSAASVALAEFTSKYAADLKVVFEDVYFLSPAVLQSVQSASNFQLFLEEMDLIPSDKYPPVKSYVSSVIGIWCQNQEKYFNKWFENSFKLDKFEPLDKELRHSSSVVDMFSMFYQTISTLSKMKGSLGDNFPGFILTLSAMFNTCLTVYDSSVSQITLLNQKDLLYPASINERIHNKSKVRKSLSLDKFSKDKDKEKEKEHKDLFSSTNSTNSTNSNSSLNNSGTTNLNQSATLSPVLQTQLSTISVQVMCVCVNNLDFILHNIKRYIEENSFADNGLKEKLAELFGVAEISIGNTIRQLVNMIGQRVIFYECKSSIVESLYINPSISAKERVQVILENVSPYLKTIYNHTQTLERGNDILTAVSRAFLQAMEYAILYGGPQRAFQPKDASSIEYDIELVKDFFLDRDEEGNPSGVSETSFEQYAYPLRNIIQLLMDQSSELLIEQYNDGKSHQRFTKENIACVLIHRPDKVARTFIKKKLSDSIYYSIKKGAKIKFLVQ